MSATQEATAAVKTRLTRKRERETPEYAAMVGRIIRAHGRRVADADPEDLVDLINLRDELDEAIKRAVWGQKANGFSWAQIARCLGVTRQAAQMRYGEKLPQLADAGHYEGDLVEAAEAVAS